MDNVTKRRIIGFAAYCLILIAASPFVGIPQLMGVNIALAAILLPAVIIVRLSNYFIR